MENIRELQAISSNRFIHELQLWSDDREFHPLIERGDKDFVDGETFIWSFRKQL